jgi:putative transposon-encoded protein
MKRKTIVTALLVFLTLSIPLSLYSQSQDFQMDGTVLVKYNGNAANVTIPAGVTVIADRAFSFNRSLTNITIPSSVTSIGNGAFAGCSRLTSITVDTQNSMYLSIEGILFNKNRTLLIQYPAGKQERSYTIPSSVTSIGNSAFELCIYLTSITIPSSVTSIGNSAFRLCTSLSVTIPSSVTSIGDYAFEWCTFLTSVTIPSSVTFIGNGAFYECSRLRTVTVSETTLETAIIGENAFPPTAQIIINDWD